MKTKLGYAVSAFLSFLLCAVMLCGAVLPASADSRALPSLDYSNPSMDSNVSLSVSNLYNALLDRNPTEGETMYWEANKLSLSYSDFIPDSCIDTQYDGEKGTLDVIVFPYSYEAPNKSQVTWIPESFTLDGKKYALREENGRYVAQVENCFYSGDFDMQVDYNCEIELAPSVMQALMNDAFEKGNAALAQMNVYNAEVEEYEALIASHNAYNAYLKWQEEYAIYVVQKANYDKLMAEYEIYLEALASYQLKLEAYHLWNAYFEQDAAYKENEKPYAEYFEYYNAYTAAVNKLSMFETVFKKDSNNWCMYADIVGDVVTQVLARQDELVAGGANKDDVTLAGIATENLRVLLKGYNELRNKKYSSEYEKSKALYQYYTDHYDGLKKNFCDLYSTLRGLYENSIVSNYIKAKGKAAHYRQLVGHLFVVSTAFDQVGFRGKDTEDAWLIDKKPLREVLEDVHYSPDGDWDPKNTAFPEKEVPYVERIEKPERPDPNVYPQPTGLPKAPAEVKHPGEAPAVVENPANTPCPPKPEQEVGEAPIRPAFDEIVEVLYQEVRDGKLKASTQSATAKTVQLSAVLNRTISIANLKTVTFYKADGSILKQESVHYGTQVNVNEVQAPREPTAEYTYEFLGWNYADESKVTSANITVTGNIALYPRYLSTKNMYTITWIVDGESYSQKLYYGVMPTPELVVDISTRESQYYVYQFSGWDNKVVSVVGDATYTGSMLRIPKKFNVTWVTQNGAESVTQQWEYGQTPEFVGDLSISSPTHLYEFLRWDKEISPVSHDVTYTAIYRETPLATGGSTVMNVVHGENEIVVQATKSSISAGVAARLAAEQGKVLTIVWENAFSVSLAGEELQAYIDCGAPTMILQITEEGNIANYNFKYFNVGANTSALPAATIQFAYSDVDGKETVFDLQTENGWERIEDAHLSVSGNFKARRMYSYAITPVANENCNVIQMTQSATAGEWISIALNCTYGYKVTGATIVTTDGETITVDGVSFQMPESPITISLNVEQIVYTVTFVVDGKVWDSKQYYAGEEIVLPENPTKAEENGYVYTFIGWGDVPAIAMGDVENLVFEASFTQSQTVNDYKTGNNNNVLFAIVLPCVAAAGVLVVGFFVLRRIVRRRGGWKVATAKFVARMRGAFAKITDALKKLFKKKK